MRRVPSVLCTVLLLAGVTLTVTDARAANDPAFDRQWNMQLVGAEAAWAKATGKGITIAVVDTGVHLTHEDFATGKLLPGRDFVTPNTTPQDDHGHGTHVAGIAAATANNGRGVVGVAPDARILPVKVLDRNGRGAANIDEGIRWAVDNGAHVVNLSIGNLLEPISGPPFVDAIRYAWNRGVICVVAAGNEFVTSSTFEDEPAIVVTATDPNDRRPSYATTVGNARWGMAAPGGEGPLAPSSRNVFSTYWVSNSEQNTYAALAGTSMATPHIAGAAALLRSLGLTPQQTVDRLLTTAKDLGTAGKDSVYGHGRLDVAKAVAGLGTGGSTGGGEGTTTTTRSPGGGANGSAGGAGSGGGSSGGSTASGGSGGASTGSSPPSGTSGDDDRRGTGGAGGATDGANGDDANQAYDDRPPADERARGDADDAAAGGGGSGEGGADDAGGGPRWPLIVAATALAGGIGLRVLRLVTASRSAARG